MVLDEKAMLQENGKHLAQDILLEIKAKKLECPEGHMCEAEVTTESTSCSKCEGHLAAGKAAAVCRECNLALCKNCVSSYAGIGIT